MTRKIKPFVIQLLFVFLLTACGNATPDASAIETAISLTQAAETALAPTATTEPTATNTPEIPPTNTPHPSPTPRPPTETPEPTAPPSPDSIWARNYLGAVESGEVVLEVVRVLVGDKQAIDNLYRSSGGSWDELIKYASDEVAWANAEGAVEVIVKFTNNSSEPVELSVDCNESNIQIGGYQAELNDVAIRISGLQTFCYDKLWPGASAISGVWVPLNNLTPDEVVSITLRLAPPQKEDSYKDLGPWFILELDVSEHRWEDPPEEMN